MPSRAQTSAKLIINYQLSTINYQKTMAIKVNARETELKFGKEATYHSAMIWKMKLIRHFLRHKKGTQIPWITQILLIDNWQLIIDSWAGAVFHIAPQEIRINQLKSWGKALK